MAENRQQTTGNTVSHEEYMTSMPWRADAAEISDALSSADTSPEQRRFILRLLTPDLSAAYDRLVELVAEDELAPSDQRAKFLVSVRPLLLDEVARLEPHTISEDGLIYDADSLIDSGYLMSARGVDEDEFQNVTRVRLKQPEPAFLNSMALPLSQQLI